MCASGYARIYRFCSCDLDLDPMTLTYELDPDIVKMHLHTKNEVSRSMLSKVRARRVPADTDRQTDRQMRPNALPQPHSRVVIK